MWGKKKPKDKEEKKKNDEKVQNGSMVGQTMNVSISREPESSTVCSLANSMI